MHPRIFAFPLNACSKVGQKEAPAKGIWPCIAEKLESLTNEHPLPAVWHRPHAAPRLVADCGQFRPCFGQAAAAAYVNDAAGPLASPCSCSLRRGAGFRGRNHNIATLTCFVFPTPSSWPGFVYCGPALTAPALENVEVCCVLLLVTGLSWAARRAWWCSWQAGALMFSMAPREAANGRICIEATLSVSRGSPTVQRDSAS